jgi:U4/U6 small nuclear ribonucleoprotein PRP31
MEQVREALLSAAPAAIVGVLEDHPEYILTVASNAYLAQLRDEAEAVREFTAAIYSQHFPDLSSIVTDGLQFARVVAIVRDCKAADVTALAPKLETVVSGSTSLVITVSGSTLDACKLTADELARLDQACQEAEDIAAARATILRFVQSRMKFLAPNLSALLGSSLASELVGMAGGLVALTAIPACNVQVMGRSKASANGMSRTTVKAHNGIIHEAQIVRSAPPMLRQKTARVLAAKVALAARIDAFRSDSSGASGAAVAESIRNKIQQWAAPPEVKAVKPLPIPEPKKSRKRGGKRFRRIKEKYGQTDVRKAANRLAVDQSGVEYSESAMGNDGGMLGMGGNGRIRVAASKKVAFVGGGKAAAARAKAAAAGPAGAMSGLTSTIAFSHTLGMELVDPDAGRKAAAKAKAAAGYFDDAAKFRAADSK